MDEHKSNVGHSAADKGGKKGQGMAGHYGWLSSFVAPKPFPEQISPFHAECLPLPLPSGAQ